MSIETNFKDDLNVAGSTTINNLTVTGSSSLSGSISSAFVSTNTTASTSVITGALRLSGGIGIDNTTDAVDSTNGGTLTTGGGIAVAKSAWIGTGIVSGTDSLAITPLSTAQLNLIGNRTAGTNTAGLSFQRSGAVSSSIGIDTSNAFVFSHGNTSNIEFRGSQSNFNSSGTTRLVMSSTGISTPLTTNSSSTSTGALVVSGGVGIASNVFIGGTLNVLTNLALTGNVTSGMWNGSTIGVAYGGTGATSLTVDAVLLGNGTSAISASAMTYSASTLGVLNVDITGTTASTSTITGALKVAGGVGIAGSLYAGGDVFVGGGNLGIGTTTANAPIQLSNTTTNRKVILFETANNDHQFSGFGLQSTELRYQVDSTSVDHIFYAATSSTTSAELFKVLGTGGTQTAFIRGGSGSGDNLVLRSTSNATKGQVYLDETTTSTSKTTGALRVAGGAGIEGSLYVNNLNVIATSFPTITVGDGDQFGRVFFGNENHGVARGTDIGTLTDDNDVSLWTSGTGSIGLGTGTIGNVIQRLTVGTTGIVNITATTTSTSSGTGALVVSGGLGVAGAINGGSSMTLAGDVVMATGSNNIRRNTSDGSDDGYIELTGGGAGGTGRGGRIIVSGNERVTHGGRVQLDAGGTADIQFLTADTLRGSFSGSDGSMSLTAGVASTSNSTGTLKITGGLGVSGNINTGGTVIFNTKLYTASDNSAISVSNDLGLVKKVGEVSKLVAGSGDEVILSTSNYSDMRTDDISAGTITDRFKILSTGESRVLSTTGSTSVSTGALVVSGGLGVSENLYVGGNIIGTISTGVIGKISPVYVRGTGANNLANRLVRVGQSEHVNTSTVGLTLVIINCSTHDLVSATNYDTSTSGTASDNLATALNNLDRQRIGILASYSSFTGSITANLRSAALRLGLYKLSETTTVSTGYCAVFRGNGTADPNTNINNQVIESLTDADSTSDYALVSTEIVGDSLSVDILPSVLVSPNPTATSPAVFVDNNNYVGIGTTDPQRILHTRGDAIRIDRDTDTDIILASHSSGYSAVNKVFRMGVNNTGSNNGTWYVADMGTSTTGSGTTRLSISNSGVVNISNTASSTSTITGALTVGGGTGISENLHVGGSIIAGNKIYLTGDNSIIAITSDLGLVKKAGDNTKLVSNTGNGITFATSNLGDIRTDDISTATITDRLTISSVGIVNISSSTASTSSSTGSLTIAGGFGISNTTDATSSTNGGTITTAGGVAIAKKLFIGTDLSIGGNLTLTGTNNIQHSSLSGLTTGDPHTQYTILAGRSGGQTLTGGTAASDNLVLRSTTNATKGQVFVDETTASTSKTTGALRVGGGAGIAGTLWAGSFSTDGNYAISSQGVHLQWNRSSGGGETYLLNQKGIGGDDSIYLGSVTTGDVVTNWAKLDSSRLKLYQTTASTSTTTGALVVDGGVGIAGNVISGGFIRAQGSVSGTNSTAGVELGLSGDDPVIELISNNATSSPYIDFTYIANDRRGRILYDLSTEEFKIETSSSGDRMTISSTKVGILPTTSSSSSTTGALTVDGGIGISNTTDATSSTNGGTITTAGGVAIAKKLFIGTDLSIGGNLTLTGTNNIQHSSLSGLTTGDPHTQYTILAGRSGGQTLTGGTAASDNLVLRSTTNATKGQVYIDETTASTSKTTGALRVSGGVGVSGSVYADNLSVVATSTPTITVGDGDAYGRVLFGNSGHGVGRGTGISGIAATNDVALYTNGGAKVGFATDGTARLTVSNTVVSITPTTSSSSITTGALTVAGGTGISENLFVGGSIIAGTKIYLTGDNSVIAVTSDLGLVKKAGDNTKIVSNTGNGITFATSNLSDVRTGDISTATITNRLTISSSGDVNITSTTSSSSITTGALTVAGGVGITGVLYTGPSINVRGDTSPNKIGTMVMDSSNNLIVRNTSGGVFLSEGDTAWSAVSDRNLKTEFADIQNPLDKIVGIKGLYYKYLTDSNDSKRRVGVIAQDVMEVLPEAVNESNNGVLAVAYTDLIPLLIEGIKELTAQNTELNQRLSALEAKTH